MSEERKMRIFGNRDRGWRVQYGYYAPRGSTVRFLALAEWPADDLRQAHSIVARENISLIHEPMPAGARPMVDEHVVKRSIQEAITDPEGLIRKAFEGLPDPLPTVEELHQAMGIETPLARAGGRQFYLYLPEPVYGLLCGLAVAGGVSRTASSKRCY